MYRTFVVGLLTLFTGCSCFAPQSNRPSLPSMSTDEAVADGLAIRLGSEDGKPNRGWKGTLLFADGTRIIAPHSYRHGTQGSGNYLTVYELNGLKPVDEPVLAEVVPSEGLGTLESLSADGRRVACGAYNSVSVYDTTTGRLIFRTPETAGGLVFSASLSSDGRRVAVAGRPRKRSFDPIECGVWDVDTGQVIRRVTTLYNTAIKVHLSPDGQTLVTAGQHDGIPSKGLGDPINYAAQVWHVSTGNEVCRFAVPLLPFDLTFAPNSQSVAVYHRDQSEIRLTDLTTGERSQTFSDPKIVSPGIAFSADGRRITALNKRAIGVYDMATGAQVRSFPWPADVPWYTVHGVSYTAPDQITVLTCSDNVAVGLDAVLGKRLTPAPVGHTQPVCGVAYLDENEVVTVGADGLAVRWSTADGRQTGRTQFDGTQRSGETEAILSANGRLAVRGKWIYDTDSGAQLTDITPLRGGLKSPKIALNADGSRVAVVAAAYARKPTLCTIVETNGGKPIGEFSLPGNLPHAITFAPDDRLVVALIKPGAAGGKLVPTIEVREANTWKTSSDATLDGRVDGLTVWGDRTAVAVSVKGLVTVVDLATGETRKIDDPFWTSCYFATISPDGKLVAVYGESRNAGVRFSRVKVYELATGVVLHMLPAEVLNQFGYPRQDYNPSTLMAFCPDGSRLATPDRTSVLVWDLTKIGPDGLVK